MNMRLRGAASRLAALYACAILLTAYPRGDASANAVGVMGAPPTSVIDGQAYDFTPAAVVIGSASVWFSIENLPPWASFDTLTGRLQGIPIDDDVGSWGDIRISITDGSLTATLPAFAITVQPAQIPQPNPSPADPPPAARSVTLSWLAPIANTDGSALVDLAAYRLYSGATATTLEPLVTLAQPGLTRYVIENLPFDAHCFAITAVNSLGVESDLSAVVELAASTN